jgi:hypothetical protein
MMARQRRYRYVVSGPGQFPTDMLRYDGAAFATTKDEHASEQRGIKTVTLIGRWPTSDRWESFLWRVVGSPEEIR